MANVGQPKVITRRRVIGGVAASLIVSKETACSYRANSRVAFGIVGTGRRGCYVGAHMAKDASARLVAICDVYPDRIDEAKASIPETDRAKVYHDVHDLLNAPDIDAVLIATPVFLHPPHFESAIQARKHICCEKPAAASVTGVKRVQTAATLADPSRTILFGFQQRFSPEYLEAEAQLRQGKIGDMRLMF
jgi:predicted dehydrogenase